MYTKLLYISYFDIVDGFIVEETSVKVSFKKPNI